MISIDTNVVVRFLVKDHEEQSLVAAELLTSNPVFVTTTVLMETEWVLRKTYRFSREQILGALQAFLGLQRVSVDHPHGVKRVLELFGVGLDFADAVHLVQSRPARTFATFDQELVRSAANLKGLMPVYTPQLLEGQG